MRPLKKPVGLLGGTFDPVHHGHLRIAVEALERLNLEAVRLIPLFAPPHRAPPQASAEMRWTMLEAAVEAAPGLVPDDLELRRRGVSYTVDTLAHLRARLPDTPFCLLMGSDAFASLPTWRNWEQLLTLTHLAIVTRGDGVLTLSADLRGLLSERQVEDATGLVGHLAGSIVLLDCPKLDISASAIRALVAAGRSPRYLVPEPVANFIAQKQLYRS